MQHREGWWLSQSLSIRMQMNKTKKQWIWKEITNSQINNFYVRMRDVHILKILIWLSFGFYPQSADCQSESIHLYCNQSHSSANAVIDLKRLWQYRNEWSIATKMIAQFLYCSNKWQFKFKLFQTPILYMKSKRTFRFFLKYIMKWNP